MVSRLELIDGHGENKIRFLMSKIMSFCCKNSRPGIAPFNFPLR